MGNDACSFISSFLSSRWNMVCTQKSIAVDGEHDLKCQELGTCRYLILPGD